jgi:cation:H+ antiporter
VLTLLLILIGSAALIYFGSEWFVNAIEWLGSILGVRAIAVGTVLAAIGTALPETIVTLMAVISGHTDEAANLGVGAALAGPLVLSTVAYGIVGFLMVRRFPRRHVIEVDRAPLLMDQRWFFGIACVSLALGFVAFTGKAWLSIGFLGMYAIYVIRELRGEDNPDHAQDAEELEALKLWRSPTPPANWAVILQTLGALVLVVWASHQFVGELSWIAPNLGLPPAAVALVLAPIATELPEIMNAVIWIRQGKNHLALANISGSMMVQATVPVALGLIFTPWMFGRILLTAALCTIAAIAYQLFVIRGERFTPRWLSSVIVFYGIFIVALLILVPRGIA